MTDDDLLKTAKILSTARNLRTEMFYDHGSVRNTAMLVAGLSIGRVFGNADHNTWDRHFAATKFLEHFDTMPGSLCGCLIVSVLKDQAVDSLRYKDIRHAATLIKNASVPKLLESLELWSKDHTTPIPAVLQNILLAIDCIDIGSVLGTLDDMSRMLYQQEPFCRYKDDLFSLYEYRQANFELANPVLRNVHAMLVNEYDNIHHRGQACA